MAFIKVLKKDDLPVGMLRELQVEGTAIALANVAGTFYAIDNICLHRGGPLSEGELMGNSVTCPWHGWRHHHRPVSDESGRRIEDLPGRGSR